ncbi:hypothetical protein OCU04_008500 [Sclerotinia nivalis]|uniref:Uncharacterized protein n=1 Tax=Sclerotinia nivalis TaxID=352851 RepID=A0A9X0AI65_9HELO|nr:hypothetical protein OCU04_008500 [Sclerotinia nivalis]
MLPVRGLKEPPAVLDSLRLSVEPATITEYRKWLFQGFLKRTIIGNNTTYTLEFQLQYVPEHFHLLVIAEALGINVAAKISTPYNIIHSKVQSTRLPAKKKHVP